MRPFERLAISLRHAPWLERADWLWDRARPGYDWLLSLAAPRGLERTINGTDVLLLDQRYRGVPEQYEPDVWRRLMAEVRPGDIVADVGAYIGLYAVALARRVGPTGRVVAFEPSEDSAAALRAHARLNQVSQRVEVIEAAAAAMDGTLPFVSGHSSESHVARAAGEEGKPVRGVSLDTVFASGRLDILKLDVEGYELEVLKGALRLLGDPSRAPRALFIEVHPYAWPALGTSAAELLTLLSACGYQARTLAGEPVARIDTWSEIIATR